MAFSSTAYPSGTRVTSQSVNQIMSNRRRMEAEHNELLSYAQGSGIQSMRNKADMLVKHQRRQNTVAQHSAEQMLETHQRTLESQLVSQELNLNQHQSLAQALEDDQRNTERHELEMQKICEESEELRELQSKLKIAYMNKERAVQQTEKAKLGEMENLREKAMNDQMEYDRQRALMEERNEETIRRAKAMEGKQMIQTQMLHRLKLAEEAAKEASKDQSEIEKMMQKIEREDREEQEKRAKLVQDTRQVIQQSIAQRQMEVEMKAKQEQEELDRILTYARQKAAREAQVKAKNMEKKLREEEAFKAVEGEIKRQQKQDEEINQLRDELWTEELLANKLEKERTKLAKVQKDKEDMMAANERQKSRKVALAEEAKIEEERYNEYLRQKYAAEEREAVAEALARAQRQIEYKRNIERQNQTRQLLYQEELDRERTETKRLQEEEAYKKQVVEEAKKQLIAKHAQELAGYLPKGI